MNGSQFDSDDKIVTITLDYGDTDLIEQDTERGRKNIFTELKAKINEVLERGIEDGENIEITVRISKSMTQKEFDELPEHS